MDESKKGKSYAPFRYDVGREKIREYSNAIGVHAPVHHDLEAARAAGCQPHLVRSGRAAVADEATIAQWLAAVPGTRVHQDLAAFAEHVIGS